MSRVWKPGAQGTSWTDASRRTEASASTLFAALQSRPGHAAIVADDPGEAEAFFARVDAQLVCQRRAQFAGAALDPEAILLSLGSDLRGPHRPRSGEAILAMAVTEARAAGLPILIVVVGAEHAGVAALERLTTVIDAVPDARAVVRLVFLGGTRLEEMLAQPEAQALATRIGTTVRVRSWGGTRWVFPLSAPRTRGASRDAAQWVLGGVVALVGIVFLASSWRGREQPAPTPPSVDAVREAAEPAPAPASEPEPVAAPEPSTAPAPPRQAATNAPVAAATAPAPAGGATEVPRARVADDGRPAPPPPAAASAFHASVQVGAFRSAENAQALAATLSARFPDVRVVTVPRDGGVFHCVRLGGFADEQALTARVSVLRAAGYPTLRVAD